MNSRYPSSAHGAVLVRVPQASTATADPVDGDTSIRQDVGSGAHVSGSAAEGLFRAAVAFDSDLIAHIVQASIDDCGVVSTWEHLVRPVWVSFGCIVVDPDSQALAEYLYIQRAYQVLAVAHRPRRAVMSRRGRAAERSTTR